MDTFFECATVPAHKKRRMHFNEFMLDVHKRMHELRRDHPEFGDPVPHVAHTIASSTQLLCFDEFQVTDVADALVMRRLFRHLFSMNLVRERHSNSCVSWACTTTAARRTRVQVFAHQRVALRVPLKALALHVCGR